MRWRSGFAWAFAGSAGLIALLLVMACHPTIALGSSSGMSAPAAPGQSIESTAAAHFLTPQIDAQGLTTSASFGPALARICAAPGVRPDSGATPPHYGPLHRRPPPSFS